MKTDEPQPGQRTSAALRKFGPLLTMGFSAVDDPLVLSRAEVPVTAVMLIDTGADMTVVDKKIVDHLGIAPTATREIMGVDGTVQQRPVYRIAVHLIDAAAVSKSAVSVLVAAVDFPDDHPAVEMGYLGRDFLEFCQFSYDGRVGAVGLSIPD